MLHTLIEILDKKRIVRNFVHRHYILELIVFTCGGILGGIENLLRSWRVFHTFPSYTPTKNYTVIILGVRSMTLDVGGSLLQFDALFSHAFRKLGVKAKTLFCDGTLWSTDAQTIFRSETPLRIVSFLLGPLMKRALRLDAISYRDYLSHSEIRAIKKMAATLPAWELESFIYEGIHVGMHAKASVIRYFLSGLIDEKNPLHVKVFRRKLADAMIGTNVAKEVVKRHKPQLLFLLHGIYATWGPFLEYFRNAGIATVMYGNMPSRFGHFIFYRTAKVNAIVAPKEWERFKKLPLAKEEEACVDSYIGRRTKGQDGDQQWYKKNFDRSLQARQLLDTLSEKSYRFRYVCYTNLAWDVYVEGHECKFFDDVFDWLNATITFFIDHPEFQLIIKPHPGELIWDKTSQSIYHYVLEHYPNLPKNICVLPANVPLNAYDLLTEKTIGLVFNGSLGLDLANLGIPVLVVADIHYKDALTVYPVQSLEDYLALLKNPLPLFAFAKRHVKLAKKYAYFYYYKIMMRIPFYRDDKWSEIDWEVMNNSKKMLALSSSLMKVAKAVITRRDILNPLQ